METNLFLSHVAPLIELLWWICAGIVCSTGWNE